MALMGGAMLKQIRIGTDGRIVDADRRVHTTKDMSKGGPDQVQWIAPGAGRYTIRFHDLAGSPFAAGYSPANPHNIPIPQGAPLPVTQGAGTYKYDVISNGTATDDPDVIIE